MSELRIVEDWSDPETRGHTIPGARYTSKEFLEQEWEGMWTKVWLLLGREAEIPNHGDWQMEEVGPEEILMVRQKDGGVKAFYNVCQHRANPLVDGPKGHVLRRFVCKYHSWAFLPDGTLNFAPDKEDFPEGNPCGKVRLQELRCETFAGFIFVNMDETGVGASEGTKRGWYTTEHPDAKSGTKRVTKQPKNDYTHMKTSAQYCSRAHSCEKSKLP